jgi:SHAQKYF class myb-like DNA-binding protein
MDPSSNMSSSLDNNNSNYTHEAYIPTASTTTPAAASIQQPPPLQQHHKHTEFLDLTNGQGGEAGSNSDLDTGGGGVLSMAGAAIGFNDHGSMYTVDPSQSASVTATDPAVTTSVPHVPGGGLTMVSMSTTTATNGGEAMPFGTPDASAESYFDPSTPGHVVETGQEHTGRWTKEEHEAFLSGLQQYGKEWKKVAAKVKTRTVVQTRTHAQKYFQKLAKTTEGQDDGEFPVVDMGTASEPTKTSSSQKRKQRLAATTTATATPLPPAVQQVARTASVASAAKVISNLSSFPVSSDPPRLGSMGARTDPLPSHGFQTLTAADYASPMHGFSGQTASNVSVPGSAGSVIGTSGFPMKIVAPAPDSTMKRGKFPEPSPAACGKRKLAEIAAARMLAGVAASGLKAPRKSESQTSTPPFGPFSSPSHSIGNAAMTMDHNDNIEDGTATPPPEEVNASVTGNTASTVDVGINTQKPVAFASDTQQKKPPGLGLSLQIVNPESLGVSHVDIDKKRKEGGDEPVTPWEGQLQALVR